MHAWQSIGKVLDYIEAHLAEEHSPEALAGIAALSPFYFQRLFTRLVKRPVNEYVKMRRLAKACDMLQDKNRRILDIALDCGFNSHEYFTKIFKTAFGITPDEYRKNPVYLSQVIKPNLLLNYTMVDEDVPLITDDIVIEITRKTLAVPENYIGIAGKVPVNQATFGETASISGPGQIWDAFHKQKNTFPGLLPGGTELGASMLSGDDDGTFIYFAGAPVDSEASVPAGFTPWTLPAGNYVVCQFEAENFEELRSAAIDKALKYLLETWLPGHRLAIEPFSAEKYTAVDTEPACMALWVLTTPMED